MAGRKSQERATEKEERAVAVPLTTKQEPYGQAMVAGNNQSDAFRALNPRQQRFILEYLVDLNGTRSAIAAGYSPKTARFIAAENLTKPNIQKFIKEAQDELARKTGITAEKVIAELAKIGFANMLDFIQISKDGDPFIDLSELTREQAAALSEATVEEYKEGKGDNARDVKRVKIKLHDKQVALVNLGKHLGMFTEKHEHSSLEAHPFSTTSPSGS